VQEWYQLLFFILSILSKSDFKVCTILYLTIANYLTVNTLPHSKKRPLLGGTLRSFKTILSEEGVWRGLYRGFTPSMAGSAVSWGLYFGW
jgi:hypothetical protein